MKVSGLVNLNSHSRMSIIGDMGRIIVEMIIMGGRSSIFFGTLNCQLIFVLFVVGNRVKEVVYVIRT